MSAYLNVNAQTAEDQLIKMAWQLKDYYESHTLPTGGLDSRYANRVQMEVDYPSQQVSLRFKLDVNFTQGDVTCFRGVEPRAGISGAGGG